MTSSDYLETGTQINYLCGPFNKSTRCGRTLWIVHQLIRLVTQEGEAFGVTYSQVKIASNRHYCSLMAKSGLLKA